MEKKINILDNSNDRNYFTMLPNYILNHSTAIDQALYMQMKKVAGDNGECFLSERTLMLKLGIGNKALKKSIKYLLGRGWIKENGFKLRKTKGGKQKVKNYIITDIWKLNAEYYQGASESVDLNTKGASESVGQVLLKVTQGASESVTNKNPIIRLHDIAEQSSAEDKNNFFIGEIIKSFESINPACKKMYGNKTQRKACENLIKFYSFERVNNIIKNSLPKTNTMLYFPSITTPKQLFDKWSSLGLAVEKFKARKKQKLSKVIM